MYNIFHDKIPLANQPKAESSQKSFHHSLLFPTYSLITFLNSYSYILGRILNSQYQQLKQKVKRTGIQQKDSNTSALDENQACLQSLNSVSKGLHKRMS